MRLIFLPKGIHVNLGVRHAIRKLIDHILLGTLSYLCAWRPLKNTFSMRLFPSYNKKCNFMSTCVMCVYFPHHNIEALFAAGACNQLVHLWMVFSLQEFLSSWHLTLSYYFTDSTNGPTLYSGDLSLRCKTDDSMYVISFSRKIYIIFFKDIWQFVFVLDFF